MRFLIIFLIIFSLNKISLEVEGRKIPEERKLPLIHLDFPEQISDFEIFFNCNDNKFISRELVCDGNFDCKNGADEEFCEQSQFLRNIQ